MKCAFMSINIRSVCQNLKFTKDYLTPGRRGIEYVTVSPAEI